MLSTFPDNYEIIALTLIFLGSIIMGVSIFKYYTTIHLAQSFGGKITRKAARWYKLHHLFMVFFLFGYLVVFLAILYEVKIIDDVFTSLIFFCGALFVLIGIILQTRMLKSIKTQHTRLKIKNEQLSQIENATIYTLASLAEIRDSETGQHIIRTSMYAKVLAEELSLNPAYSQFLTLAKIEEIAKAAPLHDIGKVGIRDSVLNKTEQLTELEFEAIKKHCEYGSQILERATENITFYSYFTLAIDLVRSHHEKWDGSGYPRGLKGNQIPLAAQLMSVADVYDALVAKRCYKTAFSHDKACTIIEEGKGKQFSPDLIDAFKKSKDVFRQISRTMPDQ